MNKTCTLVVAGLLCFGTVDKALAIPMDLGGFAVIESVADRVKENGGTVTFKENAVDAALYFYNDTFFLPADATILSFDYSFTLGEFDEADYLQFNVNYGEAWFVDANGADHVEIDITPYQGQDISLDWALIWGGDSYAGTTATISNIDLASQDNSSGNNAPVPEPATFLLFGTGFAGIAWTRLKRKKAESA
ncbi:MAG: PEP-CTERM sorting domain-containing protein [Desulfobulbaceae bacterium]|nr:PEP-CTERM sorting domain-containing protein [Desulfobulbaceae bacterium]